MDHFKKVAIEEAHVKSLFVDGVPINSVSLLVPEDSEATTVRQLREDFNALLAILRELKER